MEKQHICPWQGGSLLAASVRKVLHNPKNILRPYLSGGMTAADIGCGMGYFTLPMASFIGNNGKVIAVDLQPEMLAGLKRKTDKKGITNIIPYQCKTDTLSLDEWAEKVDFVIVFWMLHEVPDSERLIREVYAALSNRGKLLFVEPKGHVDAKHFNKSLEIITSVGFTKAASPKIGFSRAALFEKTV